MNGRSLSLKGFEIDERIRIAKIYDEQAMIVYDNFILTLCEHAHNCHKKRIIHTEIQKLRKYYTEPNLNKYITFHRKFLLDSLEDLLKKGANKYKIFPFVKGFIHDLHMLNDNVAASLSPQPKKLFSIKGLCVQNTYNPRIFKMDRVPLSPLPAIATKDNKGTESLIKPGLRKT